MSGIVSNAFVETARGAWLMSAPPTDPEAEGDPELFEQFERAASDDPEAVWGTGRPELAHIYATARQRMQSPWALLAATIGRAAASIPHNVHLETFMGKRPVNLIIAMTGGTGTGKTAAESTARDMFDWPRDIGQVIQPRSGEAIPHAYARVADKDDPEQFVKQGDLVWFHADHLARFYFDEIGTLNKIQARQGATVLDYLKSAESGADLGGVTVQGGVQLPENSYRLVATMNVQPERAGLITSADETAGGLPGRMLWASTEYKQFATIERDRAPLARYDLPRIDWVGIASIRATETMDNAYEAQQREALAGTLDPMESHGNMLRSKVACCLMVLAGRTELSDDDWDIAGLVLEHSRRVRGEVLRGLTDVAKDAKANREALVIEIMRDKRENGTSAGVARAGLSTARRTLWDDLIRTGAAEAW